MTTATAPFPSRRAQSARVSLVVAGFVAGILLLILVRQAAVLRMGFPLASLGLGIWLYRRAGFATYAAYSWWLWFLVPALRRLVDFQAGRWDPENPMSLAPFMVSAVALFTVARRVPELRRQQLWSWVVAAGCVGYGYFVGVLRNGVLPATHSLIAWFIPLMFGLAIALEWRKYPECAAAIGRAFLWGTLLLSAYAVVQFVAPPSWDRLWVESSGMRSIGMALPYQLRVFSLMNGPASFAVFLLAAIYLMFAQRGAWRIIALVISVVALMLTLVRSAWLALPIGLLVYLLALPLRSIQRTLGVVAMAVLLLWGIPQLLPREVGGPVVQTIRDRALTLGSIGQDLSYSQRSSFVDQMSDVVLDDPLGHGLGSTGVSSTLGESGAGIKDFDSGIFAVLYSLGWFAGAGLLVAATAIVLLSLGRREARADLTAKAARATLIATFALSLGGNIFEGVAAVVFWSFAGLVFAAGQWNVSTGRHRTASARA